MGFSVRPPPDTCPTVARHVLGITCSKANKLLPVSLQSLASCGIGQPKKVKLLTESDKLKLIILHILYAPMTAAEQTYMFKVSC